MGGKLSAVEKVKQTFASTGSRTRVESMAGHNSATEPSKLDRSLSVLNFFMFLIGTSGVVCKLNFTVLISFDFKSNSLLQSFESWKKVTQTVESTGNRTRD